MTDILASIDDTLADRCACGCGETLASDGPSVWYVDNDHQSAHLARQATDPDGVYRRRDAALTLVDDAADAAITEPGEACDCIWCTVLPPMFSLVADAMDQAAAVRLRERLMDQMRQVAADACSAMPEGRPDPPARRSFVVVPSPYIPADRAWLINETALRIIDPRGFLGTSSGR